MPLSRFWIALIGQAAVKGCSKTTGPGPNIHMLPQRHTKHGIAWEEMLMTTYWFQSLGLGPASVSPLSDIPSYPTRSCEPRILDGILARIRTPRTFQGRDRAER
jgi:hypothetical protein